MKLKHLLFSLLMLLSAGTAWADVEINEENFPDAEFRGYLKYNLSSCSDGVLTNSEIARITMISVYGRNIRSLKGIEYFTALTKLWCYGNLLTSLDVSKNTKLEFIQCDHNRLTSLDVSGCTLLTSLDCDNNQLTSLDVSKNTALESLGCSYNQLTSLDVSKNTSLTSLSCFQNRIKGDAMDALVRSLLTVSSGSMYVISNENEQNMMTTTQAAAAKAKGWIPYYFNGTDWYEYAGIDTSIAINSENFPDEKFRNYLLGKDYGSDRVLTAEEIVSVKSINVSGTWDSPENISSLKGIEFFTSLTSLDCSYNQLTSLDVSKNTSLTSLDCSYNQLTSLDVSKNTALTKLECDNNQLTSLDVSKNIKLTSLDCSYNQLTSLDVSKNTALTFLSCSSNQLTSLLSAFNVLLTFLSCDNNQLTSLSVWSNFALKFLSCGDNQLKSLDVSNNTSLEDLYCSSNQITSLDLSKSINLTVLECYDNQLSSLDVSKTALTRLTCYQNRIKGDAMDALVKCLPYRSTGTKRVVFRVIYFENEQNVMTTTQVAAAKAKGWTPYYTDGSTDIYGYGLLDWYEYAGVDPSTEVNNVEAADADDSAPWYTINGVQLTEKPTAPGIYIHGGKKVLVK